MATFYAPANPFVVRLNKDNGILTSDLIFDLLQYIFQLKYMHKVWSYMYMKVHTAKEVRADLLKVSEISEGCGPHFENYCLKGEGKRGENELQVCIYIDLVYQSNST